MSVLSAPNPIWVAEAPAGVSSSGLRVIHDLRHANEYRQMGWGVYGPYVLALAEES